MGRRKKEKESEKREEVEQGKRIDSPSKNRESAVEFESNEKVEGFSCRQ